MSLSTTWKLESKIFQSEAFIWVLVAILLLNAVSTSFISLPTTFWLNGIFQINYDLQPRRHSYFQSWLLELYTQILNSETLINYSSAMNCSNNSYMYIWKLPDSKNSNSSWKTEKFCQLGTQLLINFQLLRLKIKMMILTPTRRIIRNLFKMKSLWNRIQAQLETRNKIHCESGQIQNPPVEFQQDFLEFSQ